MGCGCKKRTQPQVTPVTEVPKPVVTQVAQIVSNYYSGN
jgi:hypothetical protein